MNMSDVSKSINRCDSYGTRLVWNSFKSTFKEPSKRSEAVIDETTCAIKRFKFVKWGEEMPSLFLQIS